MNNRRQNVVQAFLASAAIALFAPSVSAMSFSSCSANYELPLAQRILDVTKAQIRFVHWVKVWRFAVNTIRTTPELPESDQLKELVSDLRNSLQALQDCTEDLITEYEAAGPAIRTRNAKAMESMVDSQDAIGRLESSLQISEYKLKLRATKRRR